jgi:hypothetical protein
MLQEITLCFETLDELGLLWIILKVISKKERGVGRFVDRINMAPKLLDKRVVSARINEESDFLQCGK